MRVWGEIKKHHRIARERYEWLPGELIEGRQRIVTDERHESTEGRDFRNGLVGVACKKGQNYQGLGEYVGIKNRRVRLVADELHFMEKGFLDSVANLNKNRDFKCIGIGNPKDTTDPLGVLCCPADHLGGWDGGVDQTPLTKTWETRYDRGICIQLPGSDSPNLEGTLGAPIISQKDIDADIKFYGKDSLQFTMMDEGRMPRGQGMRRVLTRNFALRHGAMEEPLWKNDQRIRIGFLDAAYRGTGGDRCVFGELQFGLSTEGKSILALIDTAIVPIKADKQEDAEDQIAYYVKEQCQSRSIPPQNFFFDSTGRGTLMSALARLWSPYVGTVEFGGPPSDRPATGTNGTICKDYYSKFVSELWFSVRLAVESGQFRGLTTDVLDEFCAREWTLVAGHKVEVEPKDKTKIKTGRSPDLADAVAAGVEGARRLGFVIERLGADRANRISEKWKNSIREQSSNLWRKQELSYR